MAVEGAAFRGAQDVAQRRHQAAADWRQRQQQRIQSGLPRQEIKFATDEMGCIVRMSIWVSQMMVQVWTHALVMQNVTSPAEEIQW